MNPLLLLVPITAGLMTHFTIGAMTNPEASARSWYVSPVAAIIVSMAIFRIEFWTALLLATLCFVGWFIYWGIFKLLQKVLG